MRGQIWASAIAALLWFAAGLLLLMIGTVLIRPGPSAGAEDFLLAVGLALAPCVTTAWLLTQFAVHLGRIMEFDGDRHLKDAFQFLGYFWIVCSVTVAAWAVFAIDGWLHS